MTEVNVKISPLDQVCLEWMRLANLCTRMLALTDAGTAPDQNLLDELRDAVNNPGFAHKTESDTSLIRRVLDSHYAGFVMDHELVSDLQEAVRRHR